MPVSGFDPNKAANGQPTGSGFDVWDGTYAPPDNPAPHYGHYQTSRNPTPPNMVDTVTYAIEQLPKLSNAQLKTLQEQLYKAGYVSKDAVTGVYNSVTKDGYEKFLEDAAGEGLRSGPITPDQYMAKILGRGGLGPNGATDQTNTSTSTSIASAQDARALALSTFQTLLGRRPSQHEMDAFYSALTAYDRSNPTVTTQHQTGNAAGTDSTSTSTSSGGVNDQAFAQSYVDQNYGGQEGQHSALHYFDLVNSALTGPPPGVSRVV